MTSRTSLLTLTTALGVGAVALALASPAVAHGGPGSPAEGHDDGHGDGHAAYAWQVTPTGSDQEFRGLSAVSRRVAWVSGEAGAVLRTTDGGRTWDDVSPTAADGLALRDIEARDARHAVALSIGTGTDSRIYATDDGGRTWTESFRNADPDAFYDCLAIGADGTGLAMSDPVGGYFRMARTHDFGHHWTVLPTTGMPPALDGEFGFAASGTCLVAAPHAPGHFWFATGGVTTPRVFRTSDSGGSWTAATTSLRGGPSAGIYSLAFRDARHGVAVGGDYTAEADGSDAAATTRDGGRTWQLSRTPVGGYRSGVAWLPHGEGHGEGHGDGHGDGLVAVGPTGSDLSRDGGRTWTGFDTVRYDGAECARDGACWASGTDGGVARLVRR